MNKALQVFHNTPLGQYWMGEVWEWAKTQPHLYLDGEFETKEQFCAPPPPNVTEYMIFLQGHPAAHLGLWEESTGTRIALITAPYAPRKLLVQFLRQLAQFATSRGARLFVRLPENFTAARKLARLIGVENDGIEK